MKAFVLVLLLAVPLLAGCATQTSGPVTPPRDEQGRYVIKMTGALRFVPADAAVPANSTVVWVLDGSTPHDVTEANNAWTSDEEGGKIGGANGPTEYARTFSEKGTVRYFCQLHGSQMSGTLTVQ